MATAPPTDLGGARLRYRPINSDPEDPRLGRFLPDDWAHVEKCPLEALCAEEQRPQKIP